MKIQIPFYQTLANETVHITVEFECPKEPQISGGEVYFDIGPISKAHVLTNKSTKDWKRYFDTYESHDKGICVHVFDDDYPFYMGLPKRNLFAWLK